MAQIVFVPFVSGSLGVPTAHLYQGDLANLTLGAAGVPTPSAMRWFGQVNMYADLTISVIHTHWTNVPAGGGPVSIEVYRARGILTGGPIVWTLLGTITTTPTGAPQTFVLFAQAIAKNNSFDGLTLDFHFVQP